MYPSRTRASRATRAVVAAMVMVLSGLMAPTVTSAAATSASTTAASAAGGFVSVAPTRLMDTRAGLGGGVLGPREQRKVKVTGGAVPAGVSAVVMNVTVTQPTHPGFVTVWAAGAPRPTASNLNFTEGETIPNLVVAPVNPSTGEVMLYAQSAGNVHLLADVSGYFVPGTASAPGTYEPMPPTRVMDTRSGLGASTFGRNSTRDLKVTPTVPAGVSAVVMNLTVTNPKSAGFVTVWAQGESRPTASSLNFTEGQTIPNLVVAPVNPATGQISFYGHGLGLDLIADVAGYFVAGTATVPGAYKSVAPTRLMDTRSALGAQQFQAGRRTQDLQVTGETVPADVTAVVMNVTVTEPEASGFVTVWAEGTSRPTASNLNYVTGQTIPNAVFAGVSAENGKASFFSSRGSHLLADVVGYFLPESSTQSPPVPGNTIKGTLAAVDGKVTAVNAFVFPTTGGPEDYSRVTVPVASDGTYSIDGLAAGSYRVCFDRASGPSTTGYQGECVADQTWERTEEVPTGAATFSVTDDEGAGGADATFDKGAGLQGTVTAADGSEIPWLEVKLFAGGSKVEQEIHTDETGQYSVGYLPPGDYQICFGDGGGQQPTGHAPECHDDVPWIGGDTPAAGAGVVALAAGSFPTVDAQLAAGGAISGTVTDPAGDPLAYVSVFAFTDSGPWVRAATTDETGAYMLKSLGTGPYHVCFNGRLADGSWPSGYLSECHDDVSWSEADTRPAAGSTAVPVTQGVVTSGVDAQLAQRPAGTIAGTVGAAEGPLPYVEVVIFDDEGTATEWGYTDSNGDYAVAGLEPGSYRVCFEGRYTTAHGAEAGYRSECHDDVAWTDPWSPPAGASPVTVTADATTTVDVTLEAHPFGTIAGSVTDGSGSLIGTEVVAFASDGSQRTAWPAGGDYSIAVPEGTYTVCVYGSWAEGPSASGYLGECWEDQVWNEDEGQLPPGSTPVGISPGQERVGVDFVLAPS